MKEFVLKYGCNPHQQPARIYAAQGELPLTILNGRPGYINFLDALNAWQLTTEIKAACGLPAAASFKHVSPAGAACGLPLNDTLRRMYFVPPEAELSPLAAAYIRARGADRMSSFGDWSALSDVCDVATAEIIAHEVSDGIIAPGYEEEALAILKNKRKGNYNIVAIDEDYQPPEMETKEVFGIRFEQMRNHLLIDRYLLKNVVTVKQEIPPEAERDLLIALITLKYTQSNSVCYTKDGQTIGVGAGQQSRIHCTRLAGDKADLWHLRQHPYVLDLPFREDLPKPVRDNAIDVYLSRNPEDVLGVNVWADFFTERPQALLESEKAEFLRGFQDVSLGSDAFFPFDDNIARAARSGVGYIAQPGGSIRDDVVIEACNKRGIVMVFTGSRLFHH